LIDPAPTPEEAAAIAAAIACFERDTAPARSPSAVMSPESAWLKAGLLEGVGRGPDGVPGGLRPPRTVRFGDLAPGFEAL